MSAPEAARRWDSLDSLRGIAAVLVMTFHAAQMLPGFGVRTNPLSPADWANAWTWLKYTPLRVLVSSGPPAVILFFVLSGFVLALPFLRGGAGPGYAGFAVKRVLRIYPAFAAAVLLSAALYAALRPEPLAGMSAWFNFVLWDQPLTGGYVLRNLAMTGVPADMTLDLVMWSLVHELRISLVFPLLFLAVRRWPAGSMLATGVLAVACTALSPGDPPTVALSLLETGKFVVLFALGIVLAMNVPWLRRVVSGLDGRVVAGLFLAALVLLLTPGPTVYRWHNFTWGAGAVLLVGLTVGSARADRLLSARLPVWLGQVSYSLYLLHLPLMVAVVRLSWGVVPLGLAIPAGMALSLAAAAAMHRLVELPGIALGRRLARLADAPVRAAPAVALRGGR